MIKRVLLPAVVGFLVVISLASAQPASHTDGLVAPPWDPESNSVFAQAGVTLGRPWSGFPSLTLTENERFLYPGTFGWMEPAPEFLPVFVGGAPRWVRPAGPRPAIIAEGDSTAELGGPDRRLFYTGGEVDFVYGRYTGKHGGDFYQGYIIGEIGNDKFHLSVGAFYGEYHGTGFFRRR